MPDTKQCVSVLGGGIRGTAIAALLAQSQCCKVILLERDRIASGTTSTNHGRLHSGAGLFRFGKAPWETGLGPIAYRHRAGSELIYQLTGAIEKQKQSLYLVQSPEDVLNFEATLQWHSIPHRRLHFPKLHNSLIQGSHFAAAYEVPEYAFSPARLAGKFAAYAEDFGAAIYTKSAVHTIECRANGRFYIHLTDGGKIETDIIINAMGNWANHIYSELPLPALSIDWQQWRILCLFTPQTLSSIALDCIIGIFDRDRSPSAIPHEQWIAFACSITPEKVAPPFKASIGNWRQFDRYDEFDNILFETNARYFLSLQSLTSQEIQRRLFSFSGLYPFFEGRSERPYQLLHSDKVPNYYAVYGENATTALLDAVDTIKFVLPQLNLSDTCLSDHVVQLVRELSVRFTGKIYPDTSGMIWENRIDSSAFEESSL